MSNTQESQESIQLGAKLYALFTKGEILLSNVPSSKLAEIVRAASVLGSSVEYVKFTGSARDGSDVFSNLQWCQIFVPQGATARREYFNVMLDSHIVECKPDDNVFGELKIVFK